MWAVPNAETCVARWSGCLRDDGVFLAVEGVWNDAGLPPAVLFAVLQAVFENVEYIDLVGHDHLWGGPVSDVRYALVGRNPRKPHDPPSE